MTINNETTQNNSLNLLTDTFEGIDLLNYKVFANILKEIITTQKTPLTIGLYGEWGSGKTSLMQMIKNELETKKKITKETHLTRRILRYINRNVDKKSVIKTVWFDAWKFEKTHDLRVALILTILREMENDNDYNSRIKKKVKKLIKNINWFGASMAVVNQFLPRQLTFQESTNRLLKLSKEDSVKTLKYLSEFEMDFEEIVKDYVCGDHNASDNCGRLIVFIDDLDRCTPEKAIDILEALKLFLNVEHCVFIIGVDKEVIEKYLEKKYAYMDLNWKKGYLDKIIHIPFFIPPLREEIIKQFINSLGEFTDIKKEEYIEIIAKVGSNPRTIKKLINTLEIQNYLVKTQNFEIEPEIWAKLTVIQFKYPSFHKKLVEIFKETNINLIDYLDSKNTPYPILEKCRKDTKFMEFIHEYPTLMNIKLDDYVYLVNSTTGKFSSKYNLHEDPIINQRLLKQMYHIPNKFFD
ncbi:KAP family P-loop NTPase fold protein [Methanobacterium aggregans]|uniref:KAP family P-loop NTPase fold protein n=1 Tax=Methanobacterium aggregans TaxID=1615586 RepID=UPI001AE165B6|nr:P-loop NTPase fold protein [Methanobacterium aggregans]MBP2045193.1 putative KAP-like P-loop ATPase [Methanobacterium aggregans]